MSTCSSCAQALVVTGETTGRVGAIEAVVYHPTPPSQVILNDFNKTWGELVVGGPQIQTTDKEH